MSLALANRTRHVATIVLHPLDALRDALLRPVSERGPVRRVRLRIAGRVVGSALQPLPMPEPKPVENLSGDTVYRDFVLAAGTYRVELVRERHRSADFIYEDIDPADRDFAWDPATPMNGLPGMPTHPSRVIAIPLYPSSSYPFPGGSTLIRGGLLWYDGSALTGAVVNETTGLSVLTRSRPDARGDFVLVIAAPSAAGTASLQLDLTGVDAATRPDGAAYKASMPATWPAAWERGRTRSIRQAALTGSVQRADGRPLRDVAVKVVGEPGTVRTNDVGRWSYHFPPLRASNSVDITVQHPDYAPVTLTNIAYIADRTAAAPTVVLS